MKIIISSVIQTEDGQIYIDIRKRNKEASLRITGTLVEQFACGHQKNVFKITWLKPAKKYRLKENVIL